MSWAGVVAESLRWWLAVELLGFVALPLCYYLLRFLRDKGYAFSKILGIFLVTYLSWILGSLHLVSYSRFSIVIALVVVGILSSYILLRRGRQLIFFLGRRWRYVLVVEVLFLFSFLLFANIRAYSPDITFEVGKSGAEKFGNFMVLNSVYRAKSFPPQDAWLSGNTLNYYYFGHLEWATLGKLAGYPSNIAFSLALATIFGLTMLGGFSLGYNLWKKWYWALLVALAIAVFGNLDALEQFLSKLNHLRPSEALLSVDFWRSSRMIKGTITEFPYFTAILGDLHPHHSSIPTFLLAVGVGLNFFSKWRRPIKGIKRVILTFEFDLIFMGLLVGGSYAINTWDAISLAIIYAVLIFTATYRKEGLRLRTFLYTGLCLVVIAVAGRLLFHFFFANFQPPLRAEITKLKLPLAFLQSQNRTDLTEYFGHFGLFLIPVIFFLISRTRTLYQPLSGIKKATILAGFLGLLVAARVIFGHSLIGVLFIILILVFFALQRKRLARPELILLVFVVISVLVSIFCEILYFDDRYEGELERYNTVFKFYNSLWSLLALCFVGSVAYFFTRLRFLTAKFLLLALALILGFMYPIGATAARTYRFHHLWSRGPRTLDGMAYLKFTKLADDYEVIKWMRQNITGQPVVLEATGGPYTAFSRVATNTGFPTLVGWSHHVAQWRGGQVYDLKGPGPESIKLPPREQAISQIYSTQNLEQAKELLKKYNIKYVLIGVLEREKFPEAALEKFNNLQKVHSYNNSVLYQFLP